MSIDRRTLLALTATAGLSPAAAQSRPLETNEQPDELEPVRLTDLLTPAMLADVRAGTLRVDCAPALQEALNLASGRTRSSLQTGRKLIIPAGRYLLATPINLAWRMEQGIFDDGDMRRVTITGDGQANTVLFYRGDPSQPAIQIQGFKSSPGKGDGVSLRLTMSGLQLIRDLASRYRGIGFALNGAALIRLIDMEVSSFDVNIDMVDTLRVYMESVHINGGNTGLRARGGRFSNPNVYKLVHCSVSGNMANGLHVIGGCNISLDTCAFEGNGRDQRRGSCILFENGPAQGGAAGHIDNCYFENNMVIADVAVDWQDDVPGTIKLTACSFQRTSAARAASHHLWLRSRSAPLLAHVDTCAFKSFGDYRLSADRAVAKIEGKNVKVSWTANLFQHPEEAPKR